MKRPVLLIAGIVAAALVFAGGGASAHTGHLLSKLALTNSSVLNDETPSQPSETPETQASEPAEAPETEAADNDEQGEDNDEQEGTDD